MFRRLVRQFAVLAIEDRCSSFSDNPSSCSMTMMRLTIGVLLSADTVAAQEYGKFYLNSMLY
jgi:hypothetical protein